MREPKVMMVLKLSMLLRMISTGSRRRGSAVSVHVHAFALNWLTKWGREAESL